MNKANKTSEKISVVCTIRKDNTESRQFRYKWRAKVILGDNSREEHGYERWKWLSKNEMSVRVDGMIDSLLGKDRDEVYRKEYTIDCKD